MRYLGIDFGSKRVGLALSDEGGKFAMPHSVLPNNHKLVENIAALCKDSVAAIILGESVDDKGENNKIMDMIIPFKKELEGVTRLPVIYEKEYMSSQHAEFFQGKHDMLDASAAALILQRFLDKQNG